MVTAIKRCNSDHPDFRNLIIALDQELDERNGDIQQQYYVFNKIDSINTVIIACIGNEPVGCGCFKVYSADTVEIKRMFVKKEARGNKIASQILSNIESWAVELGFVFSILETGPNQTEAIALYQKSGYKLIPNYGQYIGNGNSICFKKQIISII